MLFDRQSKSLLYFPIEVSDSDPITFYKPINYTPQQIVPSDLTTNKYFGFHIEISSDLNSLFVSAPNDGTKGAVYYYTKSGSAYSQVQKITSIDLSASDLFGACTSTNTDNSTLVVSSRQKNSNTGAVYIFSKSGTGYIQSQKIIASDASSGNYFGWYTVLSSDGNTLVITSKGDLTKGSIYIFSKSGSAYIQTQKIMASDAVTGDYTGEIVSMTPSADMIFVGGEKNNSSRGAVYVFSKSGSAYTQTQKLVASDAVINGSFGVSVDNSLDGNKLYIGSNIASGSTAASAGAVYVFSKSGSAYTQTQKLVASDGLANDRFGVSLSIDEYDKNLIIGAFLDDSPVTDVGSAYLFRNVNGVFVESRKITDPNNVLSDYFGFPVKITMDGTTAFIGAYGVDVSSISNGSVYVYQIDNPEVVTPIEKYDVVHDDAVFVTHIASASDDIRLIPYNNYSLPIESCATTEDGNVVILGIPTYSLSGGSCHIFTNSASGFIGKELRNSPPITGELFGCDCGINSTGDTVVIGAKGEYGYRGAAYVFDNISGWNLSKKLISVLRAVNDYFGESVAIDDIGDVVVVGSPRQDTTAIDSGAAYVFTRPLTGTVWPEIVLKASDAAASDYFGVDVDISGDANTVIVGAYYDDTGAVSNHGSVYVFTKSGSGYTQTQKIVPPTLTNSTLFGTVVSISKNGDTIVVGAEGYYNGGGQGSVYIYERSTSGTFVFQQQLIAFDGYTGDNFGKNRSGVSISRDGNVVSIGAPNDDTTLTNQGATYVYTRKDGVWTLLEKKLTEVPYASEREGWCVATAGDGKSYISGNNILNYSYAYKHHIFNPETILGVYSGEVEDTQNTLKYFAPVGSYIYDAEHGYPIGSTVENRAGKTIGIALADRILVKPE